MKIKNINIVNFFNNAQSIMEQKIPAGLYTAIALNQDALSAAAEVYEKQRAAICDKYVKKDEQGKLMTTNGVYVFVDTEAKTAYIEEIDELQNLEVEATIQVVPTSVLESLDKKDKFGALTGYQHAAISFMIKKK